MYKLIFSLFFALFMMDSASAQAVNTGKDDTNVTGSSNRRTTSITVVYNNRGKTVGEKTLEIPADVDAKTLDFAVEDEETNAAAKGVTTYNQKTRTVTVDLSKVNAKRKHKLRVRSKRKASNRNYAGYKIIWFGLSGPFGN